MDIATRPLHVVVVDDSDVVRQHLVEMLVELGHVRVVAEAGDAADALDAVERLAPEVVVLDIQMPGASGLSLLRCLKQEHPRTRVIMLTNHSNAFYREKCLEEGADFFFDKALEFEQVSRVLGEMAEGGA